MKLWIYPGFSKIGSFITLCNCLRQENSKNAIKPFLVKCKTIHVLPTNGQATFRVFSLTQGHVGDKRRKVFWRAASYFNNFTIPKLIFYCERTFMGNFWFYLGLKVYGAFVLSPRFMAVIMTARCDNRVNVLYMEPFSTILTNDLFDFNIKLSMYF